MPELARNPLKDLSKSAEILRTRHSDYSLSSVKNRGHVVIVFSEFPDR